MDVVGRGVIFVFEDESVNDVMVEFEVVVVIECIAEGFACVSSRLLIKSLLYKRILIPPLGGAQACLGGHPMKA